MYLTYPYFKFNMFAYFCLSLLCLTKSISNVNLFRLCSWPTTANMRDLPMLRVIGEERQWGIT